MKRKPLLAPTAEDSPEDQADFVELSCIIAN